MPHAFDVAVIVPAYQAEEFLAATLATVAQQTILPAELIVVDDGSTDATCSVVESFAQRHAGLPLRLLREPHRGPGATRNAGVRAASSKWIAFLDADDLWKPEKLATTFAAIIADPNANLFCHNEIVRGLDGAETLTNYAAGFSADQSVPRQLYRRNYFSTSAVVCRRDLVLRWGGFDDSLTSTQDYELWLRMSPDLRPTFIPEVLGTYVWRDGNISTSHYWRRLVDLLRVKHRHRAKGGARLYVHSLLRYSASHLAAPIRSSATRILKRETRAK